MSETEKLDTGENNPDPSLDFDQFDIDLDSMSEAESGERTPVSRVFTNTIDFVKDKVLTGQNVDTFLTNALPEEYGEVTSLASDVTNEVNDLYDDAVKQVKPAINQLARTANKILPGDDDSFIKNKLKSLISATDRSSPSTAEKSRQAIIDENISMVIGDTFKEVVVAQAELSKEADKATQEREDVKDAITAQLDATRHKDIYERLDRIAVGTDRMVGYSEKVSTAYQKKALEIQLRSFYLQKELVDASRVFFEQSRVQGEAIVKNTGLPEFVKINESERFQEQMRNKLYDSVQEGLFGDREYIKQVAKRVKDKVKEKVSDVTSGMDMLTQAGEMYEMSKEMEELTGEKTTVWGKVRDAGIGAGIKYGIGRTAAKFREVAQNEDTIPGKVSKGIINLGNYTKNLTGLGNRFATTDFQELASDEVNPVKKAGYNLLSGVQDLFRVEDQSRVIDQTRNVLDINSPAIFDGLVKRSIVEVIPKYLSLIHAETASLRSISHSYYSSQLPTVFTDIENKPLEGKVYDVRTGKFTTSSELREKLYKDVYKPNPKQKQIRDSITSLVLSKQRELEEAGETNTLTELTPDQYDLLQKTISIVSSSNKFGDSRDWVETVDSIKDASDEDKVKLKNAFSVFKDGKDKGSLIKLTSESQQTYKEDTARKIGSIRELTNLGISPETDFVDNENGIISLNRTRDLLNSHSTMVDNEQYANLLGQRETVNRRERKLSGVINTLLKNVPEEDVLNFESNKQKLIKTQERLKELESASQTDTSEYKYLKEEEDSLSMSIDSVSKLRARLDSPDELTNMIHQRRESAKESSHLYSKLSELTKEETLPDSVELLKEEHNKTKQTITKINKDLKSSSIPESGKAKLRVELKRLTEREERISSLISKKDQLPWTSKQEQDIPGTGISDENVKTEIEPIKKYLDKGKGFLDRIVRTPISKWKYRDGVADESEHIGPMAQDVHRNLGPKVAPDGKKVDLISLTGINMSAIKELHERVGSKPEESVGLLRSISEKLSILNKNITSGLSLENLSNAFRSKVSRFDKKIEETTGLGFSKLGKKLKGNTEVDEELRSVLSEEIKSSKLPDLIKTPLLKAVSNAGTMVQLNGLDLAFRSPDITKTHLSKLSTVVDTTHVPLSEKTFGDVRKTAREKLNTISTSKDNLIKRVQESEDIKKDVKDYLLKKLETVRSNVELTKLKKLISAQLSIDQESLDSLKLEDRYDKAIGYIGDSYKDAQTKVRTSLASLSKSEESIEEDITSRRSVYKDRPIYDQVKGILQNSPYKDSIVDSEQPGIVTKIKDFLSKDVKAIKARYEMVDVYKVTDEGEYELVLRANGFRDNQYYDANGELLRSYVDISGRVYNAKGEVLLDYPDVKNGLFNLHGELLDIPSITKTGEFFDFKEVHKQTLAGKYFKKPVSGFVAKVIDKQNTDPDSLFNQAKEIMGAEMPLYKKTRALERLVLGKAAKTVGKGIGAVLNPKNHLKAISKVSSFALKPVTNLFNNKVDEVRSGYSINSSKQDSVENIRTKLEELKKAKEEGKYVSDKFLDSLEKELSRRETVEIGLEKQIDPSLKKFVLSANLVELKDYVDKLQNEGVMLTRSEKILIERRRTELRKNRGKKIRIVSELDGKEHTIVDEDGTKQKSRLNEILSADERLDPTFSSKVRQFERNTLSKAPGAIKDTVGIASNATGTVIGAGIKGAGALKDMVFGKKEKTESKEIAETIQEKPKEKDGLLSKLKDIFTKDRKPAKEKASVDENKPDTPIEKTEDHIGNKRRGNWKDRLANMVNKNKNEVEKADSEPKYDKGPGVLELIGAVVGIGKTISSAIDSLKDAYLAKKAAEVLTGAKDVLTPDLPDKDTKPSGKKPVPVPKEKTSKLSKLGSVLKKTGKGVGTVGLAAGRLALTAGKFALGALATGPGMVLLGAAALGTAAYYGYKYYRSKSSEHYTRLRLAQYGIKEFDSEYAEKILKLEESILESGDIKFNDRKAYLEDKNIDTNLIKELFELTGNSDPHLPKVMTWFKHRFTPVLLNHITASGLKANKVDIRKIDTVKDQQQNEYLVIAGFEDGPYTLTVSPFKSLKELTANKADVDIQIQNVRSKLKLKENKPTEKVPQKLIDPSQELKDAKALKEKEEKELREKIEQTNQKTITGQMQSKAPEGEIKPAEAQPRPVETSVVSSTGNQSVKVADGPVMDGSGADSFIQPKSGVDLNGLNTSLERQLRGMAEEYGKTTGKPLVITSAVRSSEKQAALYNANPEKAAPPGRSLHEFGLAFDAPSKQLDELDDLGLMRKYGFTRPVGGEPWHTEPAGIQVNIAKAKEDPNFAKTAIEAGTFKGGGGFATDPSSPLGKRNKALALSLLNKDMAESVKPIDETQTLTQGDSTSTPSAGETNTARPSNVPKPLAINTGYASTVARTDTVSLKDQVASVSQRNSTLPTKSMGESGETNPGVTSAAQSINTAVAGDKQSILKVVDEAASVTGNDPAMMKAVAQVESSLKPDATNSGTGAKGLYQFLPSTWNEMMSKYARKYDIKPGTPASDPRANALLAGQYFKDNITKLKGSTDDIGALEAYLAHFLGPAGAKKLIAAEPDKPAAEVLPSAAKYNQAIFYNGGTPSTVSQVEDKIATKLENAARATGASLTIPRDKPTEPKAVKANLATSPVETQTKSVEQKSVSNDRFTPQTPNADRGTSALSTAGIIPRENNVYKQQPAGSVDYSNTLGTLANSTTTMNDTLLKSLTVQQQTLEAITQLVTSMSPDALAKLSAKKEPNNKEKPIEPPKGSSPTELRSKPRPAINVNRTII